MYPMNSEKDYSFKLWNPFRIMLSLVISKSIRIFVKLLMKFIIRIYSIYILEEKGDFFKFHYYKSTPFFKRDWSMKNVSGNSFNQIFNPLLKLVHITTVISTVFFFFQCVIVTIVTKLLSLEII